ncbi:hypothetical protein Tco_0889791 [Tanacetum coccineum]
MVLHCNTDNPYGLAKTASTVPDSLSFRWWNLDKISFSFNSDGRGSKALRNGVQEKKDGFGEGVFPLGIYLITIYVLYYPYGDYGRTPAATVKCSANKPMSSILIVSRGLPAPVFYFNVKCNTVTKPLASITFRDSVGHVYRWDRDPFELVFERGFQARGQANTPIETYYNLKIYVHGAGRPLEIIRDTTYGFISTTLGWFPPIVSIGLVEHIYRYEIYVLGGILVPETLGES